MKIAPRWLPILGFTAVLSFFAPGISGQQAPSQPASPAIVQQDAATPPATTQAYTLPPAKLAKAIALNRIRNILDIVTGLWGIAFLWLLLATRAAAGIESWVGRVSAHRWLQGLIFFAIFFILLALANLPLDIYGHHLSTSYGISVQGWGSWFGDQAKALALTILLGAPVLLLFNWIVSRWPRRYWFGIWLITLPLILISIFVAPLLEPLFNKYEPLSKHHAALVDKLETVVARTGTNIPPDRMFLMFASLKTNGLNAYVNGIGATKRIVVWDTTAGRIPDDEVMFVFGHESGHYVLNHIPKQLAGMAAALFFVYWACSGFAAWLARRYGASWHLRSGPGHSALSTRAGFLVLIFMFFVAMFVLEPVGNTFSRHFEHEADVYGQEAIHGLVPDPQKTAVAGFNALGEAYLEDPNPSPFIEFWEYDHPSVKTRANFAANYNPWANGGHGQFFDK
jgi:STE24 endopeptidase